MVSMTALLASLITETVPESSLATYTVCVTESAAIPQGWFPTGIAIVAGGGPATAGEASDVTATPAAAKTASGRSHLEAAGRLGARSASMLILITYHFFLCCSRNEYPWAISMGRSLVTAAGPCSW